jgi:hypothetical protein
MKQIFLEIRKDSRDMSGGSPVVAWIVKILMLPDIFVPFQSNDHHHPVDEMLLWLKLRRGPKTDAGKRLGQQTTALKFACYPKATTQYNSQNINFILAWQKKYITTHTSTNISTATLQRIGFLNILPWIKRRIRSALSAFPPPLFN